MTSLTCDVSSLLVSRYSLLLSAIWELNIGSCASVDSWGTSRCHHWTSCRKTSDLLLRSVYSHHPFWGIIYRLNVCRDWKGKGTYENITPFTKTHPSSGFTVSQGRIKSWFLNIGLGNKLPRAGFYVLMIIQNTGSIYERFHDDASLWQRPVVINCITIKWF